MRSLRARCFLHRLVKQVSSLQCLSSERRSSRGMRAVRVCVCFGKTDYRFNGLVMFYVCIFLGASFFLNRGSLYALHEIVYPM